MIFYKCRHYAHKLKRCVMTGDFRPLSEFILRHMEKCCRYVHKIKPARKIFPVAHLAGKPLVSVVIPCFNYGKFVAEAIQSVLQQTLKDVEVIVVDGGSTDGITRNILQNFDFPRTRIFYRDKPSLVGDNRNFGIQQAHGRYVCCLDADDVLEPTYLEKAVFIMEQFNYDLVSSSFKSFGAEEKIYFVPQYVTLSELMYANHVMTCAVFRKKDWERTPGFVDTGIGSAHIAEDWRMWLEFAVNGARIRNISHEQLFFYRIHDNPSLSSAEGVASPARQGQMLRELLHEKFTPTACKISKIRARQSYRCISPGGALSYSMPSDDRPCLLLCMGLIIAGGAERLLSTVVGYLKAQGWRVVVVSTVDDLTENSTPISWFTAHTPEVYQLPRFLVDEEERMDFIRYLISSRDVDIVLQAGSVLLYRMLKRLRADCPSLAVVDLLFNTAPEGHIASNRKHRAEIDHIITENREVENWLLEHGEGRASVSRIYSGVSVPRVDAVDADALRASLGIAVNSLVFGFSGRLSSEKNPLAIVELASRCRDMNNVYFVMTGGGPLADVVTRQKDKLGLEHMLFMGFVDDPTAYLAMYDALLLPSVQDGRPLVVMEAMLLGTPCLASRVGGLSEMIEDGVTGFLLPPGNADALERAVRSAADPSTLKRLGAAAEVFARDHFDPAVMCRKYEGVLKSVVAARKNLA